MCRAMLEWLIVLPGLHLDMTVCACRIFAVLEWLPGVLIRDYLGLLARSMADRENAERRGSIYATRAVATEKGFQQLH